MEINREFYSGSTRQIADSNNTIVEFISNSLYTDITTTPSKYVGVEWDKSVSPWKINYKSEFFNLNFMLGYNAGYEEPVTVVQSKFFKERKKGYTFYLSSNGKNNISGAHSRLFPVWNATLSRTDVDINDSWVQDKYKELHPVINFDYSKIFTVPFLQIKNEGNRILFSENLRANFDPTNYSSWGVGFVYKDSNNVAHDLAMEIVSLNNTFLTPDWMTTNCFTSEEFDNGLSITTYDVTSATVRYVAQLGERAQYSGSNGTYFDPNNFASADIAGIMQYYPNRMIYINGTENPIYSDIYYGGFISNNMRPFRRTFASGVTFDDLAEYFAKELAYLGFRFLIDGAQINQSIDSQYFYIPEFDEKGVTTGNYYMADSTEAAQLPNNDWSTNVYNVTPYDGTDDIEDDDPNDYDDSNTTILNPVAGLYSNSFQNSYVLPVTSSGGVASLSDVASYLYYVAPTNNSISDYLSNNPIDSVISCIMFPFRVEPEFYTALPFVRFGKVVSNLKALGFIKSQIQILDCGECTYYPEYGINDFRSYEPYCECELLLPYCGSVKISPSLIYSKTKQTNFYKIGVKYIVDLITGACLGCVFLDNLLIETVNGQIGITIPVTGVRSADLQRDIFHKQTGLKQATNTALSSVANTIFGSVGNSGVNLLQNLTAGALNMANASLNYKSAEYELKHIQTPYSVRASASPLTEFANEQFPRMIIKRPVMLPEYNAENYGHSIGFATIQNDTIGNYSGYTEITGVDLTGIPATAEEIQMIKTALESGVYL